MNCQEPLKGGPLSLIRSLCRGHADEPLVISRWIDITCLAVPRGRISYMLEPVSVFTVVSSKFRIGLKSWYAL
jgi:hypothetical protein